MTPIPSVFTALSRRASAALSPMLPSQLSHSVGRYFQSTPAENRGSRRALVRSVTTMLKPAHKSGVFDRWTKLLQRVGAPLLAALERRTPHLGKQPGNPSSGRKSRVPTTPNVRGLFAPATKSKVSLTRSPRSGSASNKTNEPSAFNVRTGRQGFVQRLKSAQSRATKERLARAKLADGSNPATEALAGLAGKLADFASRVTKPVTTTVASPKTPLRAAGDASLRVLRNAHIKGWKALLSSTARAASVQITRQKELDWGRAALREALDVVPGLGDGKFEKENLEKTMKEMQKEREWQRDLDQFNAVGKAWVDAISHKTEARANNKPKKPLPPLR